MLVGNSLLLHYHVYGLGLHDLMSISTSNTVTLVTDLAHDSNASKCKLSIPPLPFLAIGSCESAMREFLKREYPFDPVLPSNMERQSGMSETLWKTLRRLQPPPGPHISDVNLPRGFCQRDSRRRLTFVRDPLKICIKM